MDSKTQGGKVKWPNRPKSLSEKGYRKFMAKTKKVPVNGQEYTLQSVSPSWYYDLNDECGMTGGKRKSRQYMDTLFRNVVVAPAEVATQGMGYFDEKEDLKSAEALVAEIESFLRS